MKSTTLNLLLLITLSLINQSTPTRPPPTSNFIKNSCTSTSNPKLCYYTLSPYAPQIKNNPKLLATKALTVALTTAQSTTQKMAQLSKHKGLKVKEAAAVSECTMAVGTSAAQLQRSVQGMSRAWSSAQKEMQASDVQTWTSAALTYAGTCLECFQENDMKGSVEVIVTREIGRLSQFTSIALALVTKSSNPGHRNP